MVDITQASTDYRSTYPPHDAVIGVSLWRSRGPAPRDIITEITLAGPWIVDPIDTVFFEPVQRIHKISARVHGLNRAADVLESPSWERRQEMS